jgi:exoribonuclease II
VNQRIRELERQALSGVLNGNDPDGDVDRMYIPAEFTKKFAELIVRECMEVANIASADLIKEHFGVEL